MRYPKYHGHYLGMVVQNNDPEKRGRVKVFVPHITPTVYKKWVENNKDKNFKFIGKNLTNDITDITEDLKKILPWAEISSPLAGENSSGRYNAFKNVGTISDSSSLSGAIDNPNNSNIDVAKINYFSPNLDNIGEKPGNLFDISYYKLKDAFSNPSETNANNANKYSYNYTPECYSNCAKGSFPIVSVGAHVWVFFNNGNPLNPVVFGASFGTEDWKSIASIPTTNALELSALNAPGVDYPGTYENKPLPNAQEYDYNVDIYRNKYVINQKGGTISFINTDNREVLKMTHYSGSFKEFNNFANIELATNNDQKLVLNDQFLTVKGTRNEFTQFDYDCITRGDNYKKIGNLNRDLNLQWREIAREIANVKQLFDIQRADKYTSQSGMLLTSPFQSRGGGTPGNCPVCNQAVSQYFTVNNSYNENFSTVLFPSLADSSGDFIFGKSITPDGIVSSIDFPGNMGTPQYVSPIDNLVGSADGSTGSNRPGQIFGISCPACGGTGQSPSSQGGTWPRDQRKATLNILIKSKLKDLLEIEKQLGAGGSEIVEITKHKVETIGTVMNDFGSIRVDMKGKMYVSDVQVAKYGAFYNRTPSPLVELVHVDDLPGGNYTMNVCNRYNVMVGAGGLNLKSYGPVNISGSLTNVAGAQVNISSELETNIDGGKRLSLVGDIVSIRQRNKEQVVIEGSLGVTNNLIVAGGLHVEGEFTANHITMPTEVQATEQTHSFAAAATDESNMNGKIIGFGVPMSNFASVKNPKDRSYQEGSPNTTGAPYLGFTDYNEKCGRLKKDEVIGYITGTIGWIPHPITPNAFIPVTAGTLPGTLGFVEVRAANIVTAAGGTSDVPVFGSGPGSALNVKGCVKGADTGSGGVDAMQMPIVVYGTGRDRDSIYVEKHSHMFKGLPSSLTETNSKTREKISGKLSPVNAEPVSNYKK